MANNVFSPDAWTRARNRFVEDLTDEEQRVFSQATPEAILYEASAAEKSHQATSTTRTLVTKLQPFVDAVEQFGKALDVYTTIHPLVMGLIWGSVRVVLQLARQSRKYSEKITDMFSRISDLLPRLQMYENLFPNDERLVQSLSKVYFDILTFCMDAKAMFRKAKYAMLRSVWKPFERKFGALVDTFRSHQSQMEKEVLLSHMIEAADSRALVRTNQMAIAKERCDQDRLRVFASLSSAVDYAAKHRKLREMCHKGTGMWLIQHPIYDAWKTSTNPKGLVLHGIPGSGKSILTSLIVDDHLKGHHSRMRTALYFYCDYADPPTLQPTHMYRAFLQQLFLRGLMSEAIANTVVEIVRVNTHSLGEQKLTELTYNAFQSCVGLHLILDGLDECERNVQESIIDTLCSLLTIEDSRIKILITCRDEGHLLTKTRHFDRLHISSRTSAADIESYTSHAITSRLLSGDLTLRNPALKEEILSKLISKAQGMFLWVYFQVTELCDAASDDGIREVLEHLPEGLHETYTRIFKKIARTGSKTIVLRIMMWMVCAKRLLRLPELQEAVAFDAPDRCWNANKIPDGDKIIKCCYGLVVRDTENGTVRLAHHTVQQYLVSPEELQATGVEDFMENTARIHFWPDLYKFRCDSKSAEVMAGRFCVAYLCFSDFGTAVSRIHDNKKYDLTDAFKDRGPVSIPAALGLRNHLRILPRKFSGLNNNLTMPDIDYSKYLDVRPRDRQPSPDFRSKFAMLEYVIAYWPWHTRLLQLSNESGLGKQFWDLVQHKTLAFEFRPWGSNDHLGKYGCKGCPVPDAGDLKPKDLPSMGLVHWAAETGHLKVFDIVEPPLQEYLKHERYHDETLLIACRNGQPAVVEILLARGTFNLSDGRAMFAACASGNALLVERLFQEDQNSKSQAFSFSGNKRKGAIALYQAASNGHSKVVHILLEKGADARVSDAFTGLTPLQIAAKNGHLEVVQMLCALPNSREILNSGGIDIPHQTAGMNALHYAMTSGHDEIVALLVRHRVGCNDVDSLGETALIKASKNGKAILAKTLLEGGADVSAKGGEHYKWWSDNQNHEAVDMEEELPLWYTRYVDYPIYNEMAPKPTALHHAAARGFTNVLAVLPYSDWTCGHQDINALHLGAAYGHSETVQLLLSKGADIEGKDRNYMTALHYASCNGHNLVAKVLLERGCKVDGKAHSGVTALQLAACAAKSETIRLLVAHGAAVEKTVSRFTPGPKSLPAIHLAARYADADTLKTLVECGAQLNTISDTPLEHAINGGKSANMLALIELGAEWIRYEVFRQAVCSSKSDAAEILLKRLSTATAKQQRDAIDIIRTIGVRGMNGNHTTKAWRMLEEWQLKCTSEMNT